MQFSLKQVYLIFIAVVESVEIHIEKKKKYLEAFKHNEAGRGEKCSLSEFSEEIKA